MNTAEIGNKNSSGLMKYFRFLFTVEGQRTVIMVVTFVLISLLLCSKYFSFNSVISKGKSERDVIAHKTFLVVDEGATTIKKNEEASKIKPVLKPAEGNIDDALEANLFNLKLLITNIRKDIANKPNNDVDIQKYVKNTPLDKIDLPTLNYLLVEASDYNWESVVKKQSTAIMIKVLDRKLTDRDLSEGKQELIRSYIKRSTSDFNAKAIIALIDTALDRPNYIIDNEATNAEKKKVMDSIEPVKVPFIKGQVVVYKGDKVTPLQFEALKSLDYTVKKIDPLAIFGIFCFVSIAMYVLWYYISRYEPFYANSPKHLALLSCLSVLCFAGFRILPELSRLFHYEIPSAILPIAAVALIISFFVNSRIALLTTAMVLFLVGSIFHLRLEDVFVLAVGLIVAIFYVGKISYYRDSALIECGFAVGLAQGLVVLCNYLLSSTILYDVSSPEVTQTAINFFIAVASGFFTGALTIAAMPHLEGTFNIITSHGLMELADQNQPLLRRLQLEAPGTFHHSLMVGTLAEAAAEAIGASTILVRVGAFYHDVGKLKRPTFFIENQAYFGSENPHDKLNPRLSKMVLAAHTKDGLELARQYKLPENIQDMIVQHHGDGVMLYFYRTALEAEGEDKIIKDQFRYMGPRPGTKESAIIMLADATESAVRSLTNPSIQNIEEMVNKIFIERLGDDQLSESPLTLKDIKVISATFIRVLKGMQHHRIEYHENILAELDKKNLEGLKSKTPPPTLIQNKKIALNDITQKAQND